MNLKLKSNGQLRVLANVVLALASLCCIIPFLLLIIASLTDNNEIIKNGYTFFPKKWSWEAYKYIIGSMDSIVRAYSITIFTTIFGTTLGLIISSMLGYGLSREDLPGSKVLNFAVLFTLLFNGGLIPTYLVYTQIFHIKNTIWAQIFPGLLINAFIVFLMRSYFRTSIPPSILESARIDGAKELYIFIKIVLPLALPIIATIGLMLGINYWNSWTNGLYYITDTKYYNIQNVLNRILLDIRSLNSDFASGMAGDILARMPSSSIRMAIAIIGVIPLLAIYPFFQRYFIKGITLGAVKE